MNLNLKAATLALWDGEGIPPVGVECEVLYKQPDYYENCVIVGEDASKVVFRFTSGEMIYQYGAEEIDDEEVTFRPLGSSRKQAIKLYRCKIGEILNDCTGIDDFAVRLLDLGVRLP